MRMADIVAVRSEMNILKASIKMANLVSPLTDEEMLCLQNALCKYKKENKGQGQILERLQLKLANVWEENKENKIKIKKLEKTNRSLENKLARKQVCMSCIELREERNFHFRKRKSLQRKIANLENKCGAFTKQQQTLTEVQKQIKQLHLMFRGVGNNKTVSAPPAKEPEGIMISHHSQEEYSMNVNENLVVKMKPDEYYEISVFYETEDGHVERPIITQMEPQRFQSLNESSSSTCQKRYICGFDGCHSSFEKKWQLASHTDTHGMPYVCNYSECSKSFKALSDHKKHIYAHAKKKN